jgi:hypothetical protein
MVKCQQTLLLPNSVIGVIMHQIGSVDHYNNELAVVTNV